MLYCFTSASPCIAIAPSKEVLDEKLSSLNDTVYPGEKHVFNGWKWQECKTYNYIMSGGETERWMPENVEDYGFQYHNAKHDAAFDAYRLINLWHKQ